MNDSIKIFYFSQQIINVNHEMADLKRNKYT